MIKSMVRFIATLPLYRIMEYLFVLFLMISTFFQGGENEYILYLVPIFAALYVITRKRVVIQLSDIVIITSLLVVIITSVVRDSINSHTILYVFTVGSILILKNIVFNQKYFISLLIAFSLVHCVILFIQYVFFDQSRPASTFVNPNWIAVWLLVTFYFLIFEKNLFQTRSVLFIASLIILLSGLYVTQSRTTIVILVFFLLYLIIKKKLIARRYFVLAALMVVMLLAALIYSRLSQDKKDPFAYTRIQMYKAAYTMFLDKPFFGIGPGNVEHVLPRYFSGEKTTYSMHAKKLDMSHSTYFETFLALGITSGLLLLGGLLLTLKKRLYGLPIAFILIAALFNNIEKSYSICLLFTLVVSFGTHDKAWYYRFRPYYSKIVFLLVSYFCVLQMFSYAIYSSAVKESDQVKVFNKLRRAQKLSPYDPYYIERYREFLMHTTLPFPMEQRIAAIERYFTLHKNLMPHDSNVRFQLALHYYDLLLLLKKNTIKDVSHMETEIRMRLHLELESLTKEWPQNVRYHYLMLIVLESENNLSGALKKAKEILMVEPNFYRAHAFIAKNTSDNSEKTTHLKRMSEISEYPVEKAINDYERFVIATE